VSREKLGEGEHSLAIAIGWLRPRLSPAPTVTVGPCVIALRAILKSPQADADPNVVPQSPHTMKPSC
jgi:hypothetical protein